MEKAIMLKGQFTDLNDIVKLGRSVGKKVFGCQLVRINPRISYRPNGVVVLVSVEKE